MSRAYAPGRGFSWPPHSTPITRQIDDFPLLNLGCTSVLPVIDCHCININRDHGQAKGCTWCLLTLHFAFLSNNTRKSGQAPRYSTPYLSSLSLMLADIIKHNIVIEGTALSDSSYPLMNVFERSNEVCHVRRQARRSVNPKSMLSTLR